MSYLVCSVAALASFVVHKCYRIFEAPKEIQHIPEISTLWIITSLLSGRSYEEHFEQLFKPALSKFGYARLWARGKWEIVVTDPKHAREILGDTENFCKRPMNGDKSTENMLLRKYLGLSNIVFSDGEEWRRHRRIANPAFKRNLDVEMFAECALELIDKISQLNQKPVIAHTLFKKLTLDILGRGMFSYDFQAVRGEEESQYLKIYNEIKSVVFNPIYFIFPVLEDWVPSRRYYHKKNDEFRMFLLEIIKKRQIELKQGSIKDDLLSSMIKATWEENHENASLTDEEVLNDLSTLFLAGHDTTANTLTNTFYYLSKYPEIQEKLWQEIIGVLGVDATLKIPTTEQLKCMSYLNCVIKESMRIITTATTIRRYCVNPTTLSGGLVIPEKTYVEVHSWAIHHNSDLFPDPGTFNPDRFSDLHGSQDQAWMAFGTGSRMCVGWNFSLMEQRVVMVMLLQQYRAELGPLNSAIEKPKITSLGFVHLEDSDIIFVPRV